MRREIKERKAVIDAELEQIRAKEWRCGGYLAHLFVKWMVLYLISSFVSNTYDGMHEHFSSIYILQKHTLFILSQCEVVAERTFLSRAAKTR